jgi:hypothetical protein
MKQNEMKCARDIFPKKGQKDKKSAMALFDFFLSTTAAH